MRADDLLLGDILDASREIAGYVQQVRTREAFLDSSVHRSAVLYQLIVIGEAVGKLSEDIRRRYPHVPWIRVKGFRNFAVHEYFSTDWITVWNTVTNDLPPFNLAIRQIIETDFPTLPI